MYDLEEVSKSDCETCRQFVRRRKINRAASLLKSRGVPKSELPKFTEKSLPANRMCGYCLSRLEYYQNANARRKMRELSKQK